jgi:UDP-glucose 4-epimerase
MKILITGGMGFIGTALMKALAKNKNNEVHSYDLKDGQDILNLEHITESMKGVDVCYHFAARIDASGDDIQDFANHNLDGTMNVIWACKKNGVKRLIFSSSAAVYGDNPEPVSVLSPLKPKNIYGTTKKVAEDLIKMSGLDYVILRYFNVYGPGQAIGNVMTRFKECVRTGRDIVVYGGDQVRDFIHIDVITEMNLRAMSMYGGIYNIGSGIGRTIIEIASIFQMAAGGKIRIIKKDARKTDIKHSAFIGGIDADHNKLLLDYISSDT